jgi:predicted ATP-dependent endonuclease of OLD family
MATKKQNSTESESPQNVYFLSLELENVRCFGERQKIDFSDGNGKPKPWTIILGDNGTGKTTILKSTVLFLPSLTTSALNFQVRFQAMMAFQNPKYIIKLFYFVSKNTLLQAEKQQQNGSILAEAIDSENKITNPIIKYNVDNEGWSPSSYKLNVFVYGASRKAGEPSISEQNEDSPYITLFDETFLLLNPEEWLLRSHYESFLESEFQAKRKQKLDKVKEILKTILPDVIDVRFGEKQLENKRSQPIVEFLTPYGWVEAKDLSLGYRTSIAWMVDFASRMFDLYPESKNPLAEPAVVLIDEIDLHLHPKWQRDLLDWLSDLCPNTQFIVTTHSPLIVQAGIAKDANIVVCRREGDHVVIDQSIEAVKGWRADQILTSDLFDIPKRDKNTEKTLERRKELLSNSNLTEPEKTELAKLNESVDALPVSENPEDDKAMEIIRKAAKYIKENGAEVK